MKNKGHIGITLIESDSGFQLGESTYYDTTYPEPKMHSDEEFIYIISGEGVAKVEGVEVALKPATAILVPPNTEHCIKRTSSLPISAIYVHSGVVGRKSKKNDR